MELRDDSERLLATILITNNLVNVTIIMLCNYFFAHVIDFGGAVWLQFLVSTVLLTFLLLLFGLLWTACAGRLPQLCWCYNDVAPSAISLGHRSDPFRNPGRKGGAEGKPRVERRRPGAGFRTDGQDGVEGGAEYA